MKLNRQNIPFTMVANEVLSRNDISLRAKGLYAYLFSKPDTWDFAAGRIAIECKENRKPIQIILTELEKAGLLVRHKQGDGRIEYELQFAVNPVSQNGTLDSQEPNVPIRHRADSLSAKMGHISNKDVVSNKEEESKKENIHTVTPKEKTIWFFGAMTQTPLAEDAKQFLIDLCERTGLDKATVWHEVKLFVAYWTEKTQSGKKERWELEKTFEVPRRLTTWFIGKHKMAIKSGSPRKGKGLVKATPTT